MSMTRYLMTLFATLVILGAAPGLAMAADNYCSRTAEKLYEACSFDIEDDLSETKANCINVIDKDERAKCKDKAEKTYKRDGRTCGDQWEARLADCKRIGKKRYNNPLLNPNKTFIDPDEIGTTYDPNPYVNMTVGHTYVLRAGEDFEETVVVHVTDEIREAEGYNGEPVLCRIVVDAVVIAEPDGMGGIEWEPEEVTDDYFAQASNGNVYYCGEISRNFEDGYLDNLDGSFFSGVEFAKAGVLMRQNPEVGQVDRQEYAIGEAEDVVKYINLSAVPKSKEGGQNPNDPAFECIGEAIGDCLKTKDSSALEPESTEFKYYLRDVGFVLAVAKEDGEITGEREELVCVGDSLDVLSTPACDLGDPADVANLLETLCELSPKAFCPDEI